MLRRAELLRTAHLGSGTNGQLNLSQLTCWKKNKRKEQEKATRTDSLDTCLGETPFWSFIRSVLVPTAGSNRLVDYYFLPPSMLSMPQQPPWGHLGPVHFESLGSNWRSKQTPAMATPWSCDMRVDLGARLRARHSHTMRWQYHTCIITCAKVHASAWSFCSHMIYADPRSVLSRKAP